MRHYLNGYKNECRAMGYFWRYVPTEENLGHDGKHIVPVDTVFGHGRVGKLRHGLTRAIKRSRSRGTRAARIERGTGRVDVGTHAFLTIRGTSDIRLTRIVGDKSILLDEFVRSRGRTTVTTARDVGSAIKLIHKLMTKE
jgi:hypothetical protein